MTDLADFLLARYADDEAKARAAADAESGEMYERRPVGAEWASRRGLVHAAADPDLKLWDNEGADSLEMAPPVAAHIARWDPAHVLVECDAKRRIVEAEPERWVLQADAPGSTVDMGTPDGMVRVYGKLMTALDYRDRYMELAPPSQTLLYLALPYVDHPDFREEWRP